MRPLHKSMVREKLAQFFLIFCRFEGNSRAIGRKYTNNQGNLFGKQRLTLTGQLKLLSRVARLSNFYPSYLLCKGLNILYWTKTQKSRGVYFINLI